MRTNLSQSSKPVRQQRAKPVSVLEMFTNQVRGLMSVSETGEALTVL